MGRKAVFSLLHFLSVVLTLLLLAAAVLSWRASFVPPTEGRFWATLALLMPVILVANLVALIVWLVRREWWVSVLPAAALLFNLGYIASMVRLPDIGGERTYDLRVGSLNVNGFRRLGKRAFTAHEIAQLAAREGIDVLCLQEFQDDSEVSADSVASFFAGRMPHFVRDKGEAVISRFPIVRHGSVNFPQTNNGYLWADLDTGRDTVRVISVHLQTSGISSLRHRFRKAHDREAPVDLVFGEVERNSRRRVEQVSQIRALVDSTRYPVILAGDFNDTPSSYTYRRLKGELNDGFRERGSGYGGTFRYLGGLLRIDYIFYDDSLRAVRYEILKEDVSDHKAVVADLEFSNGRNGE
ncbi:endonuclease/exonuclease/phosphatase family protein [Alistipes sp.]|uniref:endonuclease/exonuclease/phosphatase family protein n=1 Tax=Alistipes sp. TaxID=1872444 RepID=UPI003AF088E7